MIGKLVKKTGVPLIRIYGSLVINLYAGCSIRCVYCSMRSQGRSMPLLSRRDIDTTLRIRLRATRPAAVALGMVSDIYPPEEAQYGLARHLLNMLAEEGIPFNIVTKSDLVLRDIDLLAAGFSNVCVSAGITDENAVRLYEPGAPDFARRVDVVRQLCDAGLAVQVSAPPWIPGVSSTLTLLNTFLPMTRLSFGALDLGEHLRSQYSGHHYYKKTSFSRAIADGLTQDKINRAYLHEAAKFFDTPRTRWLHPPATAPITNHPAGRSPATNCRPIPIIRPTTWSLRQPAISARRSEKQASGPRLP